MIFLYCIQETDKPKKMHKIFNIIKLEQNRVILPITKSEKENGKISQKKEEILAKNIVNKLKNAVLLVQSYMDYFLVYLEYQLINQLLLQVL